MSKLAITCRNVTTFTKDKAFDEEAYRQSLQRLVDSGVGVYMASGGSGEGSALLPDELLRLYKAGVAVCKGKVPCNANPPEGRTALETIDQAKLAVAAGVDVINVYGPAASHGYRPTDEEIVAYFEDVLSAIRYPVALAPNPVMTYSPKARTIADLANRHTQVVAVNLSGLGESYFIALKDALKRDVEIHVPMSGSVHMLTFAGGVLSANASIIPKTVRRYVDLWESRELAALGAVNADLNRLDAYTARWTPANPRWLKMAMKVLKLPGGEGGVRKPYLPPSDEELRKFGEGLLNLRIPEIDELALTAGLRLP